MEDRKVIFLGDQHVGKNSLYKTFQDNNFQLSETLSSQFSLSTEDLNIEQGIKVVSTIGDKSFVSLLFCNYILKNKISNESVIAQLESLPNNAFFGGANAAVLVYDVSEPLSFSNCIFWLQMFLKNTNNSNGTTAVFLVANKVDLAQRNVTSEQAVAFIKQFSSPSVSISHLEVSCLDSKSVHNCFHQIFQVLFPTLRLVSAQPQVPIVEEVFGESVTAMIPNIAAPQAIATSRQPIRLPPPPPASLAPSEHLKVSQHGRTDSFEELQNILNAEIQKNSISSSEVGLTEVKLSPSPPEQVVAPIVTTSTIKRRPPPIPESLKLQQQQMQQQRTPASVSSPGSGDELHAEIQNGNCDYPCVTVTLKPRQSCFAPITSNILYFTPGIQVTSVSETKSTISNLVQVMERVLKRKNYLKQYTNPSHSQTMEVCFYHPGAAGQLVSIDLRDHLGGLLVRDSAIICTSSDVIHLLEHKQLGSHNYLAERIILSRLSANTPKCPSKAFIQASGSILKKKLEGLTSEICITDLTSILALEPSLTVRADLIPKHFRIQGAGTIYLQTRPPMTSINDLKLTEAELDAINASQIDEIIQSQQRAATTTATVSPGSTASFISLPPPPEPVQHISLPSPPTNTMETAAHLAPPVHHQVEVTEEAIAPIAVTASATSPQDSAFSLEEELQ